MDRLGWGVWHLPDTEENRKGFRIGLVADSLPSEDGMVQLEAFKRWLRSKRYSENTISTYSDALKSFFVFYRNKTISEMNNDDVIYYNNEYILKNHLSASFQNQIVTPLDKKMEPMYYYVYVLLGEKDDQFYTGYTSDLRKRLNEHQSGNVQSTKYRMPLKLIYFEGCLNQQDATRREKYLKSGNGKIYLRNRMRLFFYPTG